jgi:type IV secretion system protein VirD4
VIADILADPDGAGAKWDHWQTTAHALLVGTILHVLYAEPVKTLAGVGAFLSDPNRTQEQTLEHMLRTGHLPSGPHPVVAQVARSMLNKADNEMSGVVSTATSCLDLFRDPLIARSTSTSDFRITDLMNLDHPVSLYLVVPPSDLSRLRRLIRLVLNQVGQRLTERMEFAAGPAATNSPSCRLCAPSSLPQPGRPERPSARTAPATLLAVPLRGSAPPGCLERSDAARVGKRPVRTHQLAAGSFW